eukprot:Opistho-1_new@37257
MAWTTPAYVLLVVATLAAFQVFLIGSGWIANAQPRIEKSAKTTCDVFPPIMNRIMGTFEVFFRESGVDEKGSFARNVFNQGVAFIGPILVFAVVETSAAGIRFATLYPSFAQFASFALTTPVMYGRFQGAVASARRAMRISVARVLVGVIALAGTAYGHMLYYDGGALPRVVYLAIFLLWGCVVPVLTLPFIKGPSSSFGRLVLALLYAASGAYGHYSVVKYGAPLDVVAKQFSPALLTANSPLGFLTSDVTITLVATVVFLISHAGFVLTAIALGASAFVGSFAPLAGVFALRALKEPSIKNE